jgi:hypothetical protein
MRHEPGEGKVAATRTTRLEPSMTTLSTTRELAHRSGDGLDVRLLWDAASDRLTVAVADHRTGESFAIPAPRSNALHAFTHPFAYAR